MVADNIRMTRHAYISIAVGFFSTQDLLPVWGPHTAHTDGTDVPGVEIVSALGGVEVGWITVPLGPGNLGG